MPGFYGPFKVTVWDVILFCAKLNDDDVGKHYLLVAGILHVFPDYESAMTAKMEMEASNGRL